VKQTKQNHYSESNKGVKKQAKTICEWRIPVSSGKWPHCEASKKKRRGYGRKTLKNPSQCKRHRI